MTALPPDLIAFLEREIASDLIALGQLGLSTLALMGVVVGLIQIAELRKQRLSAETLTLINELEVACRQWRVARFSDKIIDYKIDESTTRLMGLYEVFSSFINRGALPKGASSFALNHMSSMLSGLCADEHGSRSLKDIAQDDNVYDEIRYCILCRPIFFKLFSDECLQDVMFRPARPALFENSPRGLIYRLIQRTLIKRRLEVDG